MKTDRLAAVFLAQLLLSLERLYPVSLGRGLQVREDALLGIIVVVEVVGAFHDAPLRRLRGRRVAGEFFPARPKPRRARGERERVALLRRERGMQCDHFPDFPERNAAPRRFAHKRLAVADKRGESGQVFFVLLLPLKVSNALYHVADPAPEVGVTPRDWTEIDAVLRSSRCADMRDGSDHIRSLP